MFLLKLVFVAVLLLTIACSVTPTETFKEASDRAGQLSEDELSETAQGSADFAYFLVDSFRDDCEEHYGYDKCFPSIHRIGFLSECEFAPDNDNRWNLDTQVANGPVWLVFFADAYGKPTGYEQLSVGKWNIDVTAHDLIPCWEEAGLWPIKNPRTPQN